MTERVLCGGLQVAAALADLVRDEIAPETGIVPEEFWSGFESLLSELTPQNQQLLDKRESLQQQIDEWHRTQAGFDGAAYLQFLADVGYLSPVGDEFKISTQNVDEEIANIAGPQLVVPASNARFALNAANARWGSLYDALYGTDAIDEADGCERGGEYNLKRGAKVVQWGADFLDKTFALANGSHADVVAYVVSDDGGALSIQLQNGEETTLADVSQWVGFARGDSNSSADMLTLLFRNHGLHVEVHINKQHPIGKESAAGVCDIVLEATISTIIDCEDSVAAVDASDKVGVYRNWLGLMKGTLTATFNKGKAAMTRTLNGDRHYTAPSGEAFSLRGRSLLLVRNVGHLMTTDAVLDAEGNEIPEGLLDAAITTFCALHDLQGNGKFQNSPRGSIYIVKPKMHGAEEVAFANTIFARVEGLLNLPANTLKIGLMDEERRTSANLQECIRAVRERLVFINTGFLDRTGDEIHTSMEAGAVLPKAVIKQQAWIEAYEARNVGIGLRCGLQGVAQIGKGMWAMPDEMKQMLAAKQAHPQAGANCAWVPSPTAATLHATHYHQISVRARQDELKSQPLAPLEVLLSPPLLAGETLSAEAIQAELDNNAQGILGYVVRWVEQGIGCSKVPDINNVGLMEDRATLRIASQLIANWLRHGLCDKAQVLSTLKRMAKVVDEQNKGDAAYKPMSADFDNSTAFAAACALIFEGCVQPSGYTEPILHQSRAHAKSSA